MTRVKLLMQLVTAAATIAAGAGIAAVAHAQGARPAPLGGPETRQDEPRRPAAPRQQHRANGGLEALDDERVLTEIAGRGLDGLLRHAFERHGVAEQQRAELLARISLRRLEADERLPTAERRRLVAEVIAASETMIREARSPQLLLEQAQLLIARGIDEEARLLEYFGDNPELRRYLEPVARAIDEMLETAADLYRATADQWEERIAAPNDPAFRRWQEADALARQASDFAAFADYYRIIAADPEDPERIRMAETLLETIGVADNPNNPRRTFVQNYLGKVALARGGQRGLSLARDYFEAVIANSQDEAELFDAYFFRTVAEVADRNLAEARRQYDRFMEWYGGQSLEDRRPLVMVLEYRVLDAEGRFAATAEARRQAEARATRVLVDLVEQYEGYRPVVTEQLLARLETEADLAEVSAMLLDAMVDRGRQEALRLAQQRRDIEAGRQLPDEVPADEAVIERGIAAADELVRRAERGEAELDPAVAARNAFLKGLMQDMLGRRLEAAETFIAYGEIPGAEQQQKLAAYRRALGILEELRPAARNEDERLAIDALEARLLPILVNPPFSDRSRAFDLANRLHRTGQLDEAVRYYRQVPEEDPRKADAAYLLLLAEAARLEAMDRTSPLRATVLRELPSLARETMQRLAAARDAASGQASRQYQERLIRTRILLARLSMAELDQPEQALELLDGIEREVQGLAEEEQILAAALPLRFQATAAAGRLEQTTADLLALLERSDARTGLAFISQFRQTLNRAMDRAIAAGDAAQQRQLMETRAAVTPRLVEWIEQSDDPEYRRYIYNFRRFNAETQLQAARLAEGAERRDRLSAAREAFEELESPENLQRFRQLLEGLTDTERAEVAYDREVVFALGNIAFEQEDYEEARARYTRLLADRAMGGPTRLVEEDGVVRQAHNDDFWEVYLKFIRSNLALGHDPQRMAQELRRLYVAHGQAVGGTKWRAEYEALRQELVPEFSPPKGTAEPNGD